MNYGFIPPVVKETDMTFGALLPEGKYKPDWRDVLPVFERQRKRVDVRGCVSFAINSALEMVHKRQYGTEPNYSDRFLAKNSNTTSSGNDPRSVFHSVKYDGEVAEEKYPFPDNADWDEYYAPVPASLIGEGQRWLDRYEPTYKWVETSHEALYEALRTSPVPLAGYAWAKEGGFYVSKGMPNHEFVLVAFDNGHPIIWDSYDEGLKTLSKDYEFFYPMNVFLDKRTTPRKKPNWFTEIFKNLWNALLDMLKLVIDREK